MGMLVVVGALVLGTAACSDDGGDASKLRDDIVEELTADGAIDEETAGCIADAMIDEFGADKLTSAFDEESDDMPPEVEAKMGELVVGCMGVPTT
jgi:hypothetical protein